MARWHGRIRGLWLLLVLLPAAAFEWGGIFGGASSSTEHATDELDKDTFDDFMKKSNVKAVLFYAPWCFYSQQLMPSWDTAAQKLLLHDPPVHLAKIDTHKYSNIGDRYGVDAFPTMKLFIDDAVFEFDSDLNRSWQSIVKWVNRHIDRDHILKSAGDADKYMNDNDLAVIGVFPDESTGKSFMQVSRHFSDVMFAEARGETAKEVAEHLAAHATYTCETIQVGRSAENAKQAELPREQMLCSDHPRNHQRPEWKDRFSATVVGKTLTVRRTDDDVGWDQNLQMKCCDDEKHSKKEMVNLPVPSIVMFMPHDERFAVYDGNIDDTHALDRWIMARRAPMVTELTLDIAEKVFNPTSERLAALILFQPTPDEALSKLLQQAAKRVRGLVHILHSGMATQLDLKVASIAGLEEDQRKPVLTILEPQGVPSPSAGGGGQTQPHHGMRKFRIPMDGLTEDQIVGFVTGYTEGKLRPYLKSEPEPTAEEKAHNIPEDLVGTTFSGAISEESMDVLVTFYAPWCGHCRKFEPTYKTLAKKLKHVKTLRIARIDATRNEVEEVVISGYPTIILFPSGTNPKNQIQFHGKRSPEEMTTWLQEHATHKFDPTPPATAGGGGDPVESGLLDPSEEDL